MTASAPRRRALFRRRLAKGMVVIPGVVDALGALLARRAGFEAIYLTGAGLSVSLLGQPDIGLLTLDDVVETARRIARAADLPLLVDADTGFGGELNVQRAVRSLEAAGAAGLQIEDQGFPKRCGHLAGKSVVPAEVMVAKVRAARAARRDPNFLIVARTDARAVNGLADALKRAEAYRKAGADVIFPEALRSAEEFRVFGRKKALGVLLANMTEFGLSPALSAAELSRLGFRAALFPMTAFRVAAHAMESAFSALRHEGRTVSLLGRMQTRKELYDLIGYRDYDGWEKELLKPGRTRQ